MALTIQSPISGKRKARKMARFSIAKGTPKVRENSWTEDVKDLFDATEADPEMEATFTIPVQDEGKELSQIRSAAKALNKTVRVIKRDDSAITKVGQKENGKSIYAGDLIITIALRDKYKDGRGRKPGNGNGASAQDTVPVAPEKVVAPAKGK